MRVIHSARSVFAALLTHTQIRAMFQEFDNVPVGYRIHLDGTKKRYVRSLACSHVCIVQPLTHFVSIIYKHSKQTWAICSVLSAEDLANADLDHKEHFTSCIQELLPIALSDGDFPMRNMGAVAYDSGGRNYSKCVLPTFPRHPCALPTFIPPPSYPCRFGGLGSTKKPYLKCAVANYSVPYLQPKLIAAHAAHAASR